MRVLALTDSFVPSCGGVERVILRVGSALGRKGVEFGVLTLGRNSMPGGDMLGDIRIFRVNAFDLTRHVGFQCSFAPGLYWRILGVAMIFRPDILHANNIFFLTSVVAPLIRRRLGIPLVTTMHLGSISSLPGLVGRLARAYEATIGRRILMNSDLVVAVSESVRRHGRGLGVPENKIVTVRNAVDFYPAPDKKSSGGPKRVLFIGRLIANKGPHIFIKAAERVLERLDNVHFDLVGDGPMRRDLEKIVLRRGLRSRIHFWGFREDVRDIISHAAILVRPSFSEGLPLTVLEAMACGVPVIASRLAGVADIVTDGENGILVDPGDVASVADAITSLLHDEAKCRLLAESALTLVESYRGWDRVACSMLGHYETLLQQVGRLA